MDNEATKPNVFEKSLLRTKSLKVIKHFKMLEIKVVKNTSEKEIYVYYTLPYIYHFCGKSN